MAKELGQIHTVNYFGEITTAPGRRVNIDLPGELTTQLQNMVRAGNYFKVTGIDMSLTSSTELGGGQLSGHIRYFAPTKGRCAAFREAFAAMRNVFQMQGIDMRANKQYDFRAPLNDHTDTDNIFANQATLDGDVGLALRNDVEPNASILGVWNKNVQPTSIPHDPDDLFRTGFKTILADLQTNPTDFVLNDEALWSGNEDYASEEYEEIPFMLSWTPDTTDIASVWQWRPDPALYLPVLCGQMQIFIEEINLDGGAEDIEMEIAVHVAGWKSIMGDPANKKKKKSKRLSHGRKHRK